MKIYSSEMIKTKINKQKKIKRALKYILYPIAILIVICALSILYQKLIKKQNDINLLGFRPYIIISGSMEPDLQIGDMIVSKKVREEQIEIGDIITFEDENGSFITHRVMDIMIKDGEKLYQTKGDSNNAEDIGLVSAQDIKGEYAFKIRGAGKLATRIMTPTGLTLITLIMAIAYINASKRNDRKIARHLIRERYKKENVIS